MRKLIQVLVTYLTRKFMVFCLVSCLGLYALSFLLPQVMREVRAMFVSTYLCSYPSFMIGMHLKQQIASPRASLMPGYRLPHLAAAGLMLATILLIVTSLECWQAGFSPVAYTAFLLASPILGTCLGAQPRFGIIFVYIAFILFSAIPGSQATLREMLYGQHPVLAWGLLSFDVGMLLWLVHHLWYLNEDHPAYARAEPLQARWDQSSIAAQKRQRISAGEFSGLKEFFLTSISRRLEQLTRTPAVTSRQRVALVQLGDDFPTTWKTGFVLLFALELGILWIARESLATEKAFRGTLMMSMEVSLILPWGIWLQCVERWPRFGNESLRPVTRRQWVVENSLAVLASVLPLQAAWIATQAVVILWLFPQFVSSSIIRETMVWISGGQILIFGAGFWLLSYRSPGWMLFGFGILFLVSTMITAGSIDPDAYRDLMAERLPNVLLLGPLAAVTGFVFYVIAFRRWCRVDLA